MDTDLCEALITVLDGQMLFQGTNDFEEARTSIWNLDTVGLPVAIVKCLSATDIALTLKFAKTNNLRICVHTAGGHSDHAVVDNCVVIDLSLLRSVRVNASGRTATVQGGATVGEVDRACKPHGLALPMGHAHHLGVAGMVMTGTSGLGYLSRTRMLTANHLQSATLVTCNGKIITVSKEENEDLFWGLKGAGANFGIIVDMVFSLCTVAPKLFAGDVVRFGKGTGPGYMFGFVESNETREQLVLKFFEFFEGAPDECSALCVLVPKGPVVSRIVYCPKEEVPLKPESDIESEARAAFEPLTSYGYTVWNGTKMMDYWDGVQRLGEFNPSYYYTMSANMCHIPKKELTDIVHKLCAFAGTCPVTHKSSGIIIQPLGGVLSKLDPTSIPTAEVFSKQKWWIIILTEFPEGPRDPHIRNRCIRWVRDVYQVVERYSISDQGREKDYWTETLGDIYGTNIPRLKELKKKYDPENVFSLNRNIKPV